MADLLQYTLSLRDMISERLQRINMTTDAMLDRFGSLERLQRQVSQEFSQMGSSVSTLQSRINLLRAERDLLPANGLTTIRTYNREINRLERQVTHLQNNTGGRLHSWFSEAMAGLPGLATNPLILAGAGLGIAIRTGMETDLQKTNITTLLKGDVDQAKTILKDLSQYQLQSPYDKGDLFDAQKTMMSFGLSSEFAFGKLKNIGDIAMGDAQRMKSLTLAFSQATSAGRLQGQDLLQMINAGFNPLQIISERTGESITALRERMQKGGVSAKELAQALEWATDKQGLFYKGAEKAGNTLKGKLGTLMASLHSIALKVYEMIAPIITPLVELSTVLFNSISGSIGWLIQKFEEGNTAVLLIAGGIGIFTTAMILHNTYTAIATAWQNRLTWAVIKTNLAFLANPITWVIAGIIALIAIIAYCIVGVSGWGKAWEHTVQGMKYSWEAFILTYKAHWNTAVNAFMAGIDACKLAWYKFKEAVGLGDSSENQAMISKIQNDLQERAKSVTEGYKKAGEAGAKAKEAFGKAWDSLEFKSFKEVKDGLMGKLGMKTESSPAPGISPITGDATATTGEGVKTKDNIVSGGTRQTHINIQIGNVGTDTKVYVSSVREGVENFGAMVKEELLRAINSINQLQTS